MLRHVNRTALSWATWGIAFAAGVLPGASGAQDLSLRFFGHGTGDIDRVKIAIDAPATPADVGGDFTLEWFLRANLGDNSSSSCTPGNDNWITGNIVFDRDIYGGGDFGDYGVSLRDGRIAFGVANTVSGDGICGASNVADGIWHHVAVTRNASTGELRVFVDGQLDGSGSGPSGNVSYNDGRLTGYPNSDPFLVIGAEKHDAGPAYPSYNGFIDEVRLSSVIRYAVPFTPPAAPFVADGDTAALYHFDDGPVGPCTGAVSDSALGGQSPGACQFGGSTPAGPVYSSDTPFNPSPPSHDAVVLSLKPVTLTIPAGATQVTKKVRVKLRNGDAAPGSQELQLTATTADCPASVILAPPDFDAQTAGIQSSVTLASGKSKTGSVLLQPSAADFATFNAKAPARCTVVFTATVSVMGNADPTPANAVTVLDLNVIDKNDPEQTSVHESTVVSIKPITVKLRDGASTKTVAVKPALGNADVDEVPGDTITLTPSDGDCPAGVVGTPDYDPDTIGDQGFAIVKGRTTRRGTLPLTISAAAFTSPNATSPARCTALLSASGPGGDSTASNNVTRLVIDVIDANDF